MTLHRIIELAVSEGKRRQSVYTGFVHDADASGHTPFLDRIPTYENLLFVLALLRSRDRVNIQEAKNILDKLLHYQNQGNFPLYLHSYPYCDYRWHAVKFFPPLYWIMTNFHRILGEDLRERLKLTVSALLRYCRTTLEEHPANDAAMLQIGCAEKALGPLINEPSLEARGEEFLKSRIPLKPQPYWYISSQIARILSSLQMLYPSVENSPWKDFWHHISSTWHRYLHCYCGPALNERQWGDFPQPSLYDLYMAYYSGDSSEKWLEHPVYLQGALVFPTKDQSRQENPLSNEGWIEQHHWKTHVAKNYTYSVIEKSPQLKFSEKKGFHPFRLVWGDQNHPSSLVCQGGNVSSLSFIAEEHRVDLFLKLGDVDSHEVVFFLSIHNDAKVTVDNASTTAFQLDQEVAIDSSLPITLQFTVQEGEGEFMGHLMQGNRPAQVKKTDQEPFIALDWQIILRTLRRSSPCTIHVSLKF